MNVNVGRVVEELAKMSQEMDREPVNAGSIGANLCISGVPNLSQLPKGTIFKFPPTQN